jgi:5-methylcytosine-specific restriction endonuclease McrA
MSPSQYARITHYIPPAKFNEVEKEFVEPNPEPYFIFWLFGYRCMDCKSTSHLEINEIKPRGRSKKNILDWKNRVVLCHTCHEKFHHSGVTPEKILAMQEQRVEYLKMIGKGKYG